jgi:hypothetical protein
MLFLERRVQLELANDGSSITDQFLEYPTPTGHDGAKWFSCTWTKVLLGPARRNRLDPDFMPG